MSSSPAVVDDDVSLAGAIEMRQGGGAVVLVRQQVEFHRDAGARVDDAPQAAAKALVGAGRVALLRRRLLRRALAAQRSDFPGLDRRADPFRQGDRAAEQRTRPAPGRVTANHRTVVHHAEQFRIDGIFASDICIECQDCQAVE
ncbi:MAG: hypothetical protein OXN84_13755 [Albidovulum sp.]|nr:hypothetical protein [Albidovulum sp.]MDE0534271.1 hypothetical protein [Albidovulum sp.]